MDAGEHASYGIDFPSAPARLSRLEEALTICRAMFDQGTSTFSRTYYQTKDALNVPSPVRRIPILVGGGGTRTLGIAARHADAINISAQDHDGIPRRLDIVREACAKAGRDPSEITLTAFVVPRDPKHVRAVARQVADLGLDGLIIALTSADASEIGSYGALLEHCLP